MRVNGEALLDSSIDRAWSALLDADVLARTIPGCEKLTEAGSNAYEMTTSVGVGMVRGTYLGHVRLSDLEAPNRLHLHASAQGGPGTITADVDVQLTPVDAQTTRVVYDANAVLGGMIGGVGQRVLSSVARKNADEFFGAVNRELRGEFVGEATAESAIPAGALAPAGGFGSGAPGRSHGASLSARRWGDGFASGVLIGAVTALAGVIVGGRLARRCL